MLNTTSTTMMALGTFLLVAGAFQIWGKNWWSAGFGLFYLVGGFLIHRRFYVGIVVAMVPLVGSVAFLLLAAFTAGVTTRWLVDVLLTLLFVSFLVRSVLALRDTRQLEGLEPVA